MTVTVRTGNRVRNTFVQHWDGVAMTDGCQDAAEESH